MGVELTKDQRMAVENNGGSLLVSAAAGSGKTKVLVERLFDRMAQGANVDDFLIITYTKAAAAELRGKIAAELAKRVSREPGNGHLRQQMFRVYQADIRTVDAFCAALLRENVVQLPVLDRYSYTPDFRIIDEQEAKIFKQRVLEHTLEEFYENLDDQREQLAETLGAGRSDEALEQLVLSLHEKIQSHPRPLNWLKEMETRWQGEIATLSGNLYAEAIMTDTLQKAAFWSKMLRQEAEKLACWPDLYDAFADRMLEVAEQLEQYAEAFPKGWDAMAQVSVAFRRMGRTQNSPEKDRLKTFIDRCKADLKTISAVFSVPEQEHLADMNAMAPAMRALLNLTGRFSENYQTEKVRRNVMDFSDQEHYAIMLLTDAAGTPTELARHVAKRYVEIMVDEYQDTNAVQNCIFSAISKEEQNLFTVGDVKQSIYRFRLADPTIFLEKYLHYKNAENAGSGEPRRVLLSRNFRSRREVLDTTNFVFRNVLSPEMGEMEYGADEQLYFGAEYYLPRNDCDTEFHLVSVVNTETEQFDRTKMEARFVADRIRQLLDEGYPVQDGEEMRPCRPEDIVVLMRSPSGRLKDFTAALIHENIPCSTGESSNFFDTVEIAVVWSFLQIIDNPRQDVPLISVLRSPLFGYTADELAMIRMLQKEGEYYEALCLDGSEKTKRFLTILEELRGAVRDETADVLLWHLYDRVHALAIFGAMPDGAERRNNLVSFYTYVQKTVDSGKRQLFDVVTQLRTLLERGDVPNLSPRQSADGVQIMSIHRSKGLEFPIVILCDLHKSFNRQDFNNPVLIHPQMGLGTEFVDREKHIRYNTISKVAVSRQLTKEAKSEELRILYVAMTRPKEKLILVDCMRHAQKHLRELLAVTTCPVEPEVVGNAKSLGDWILLPLLNTPEAEPLRRYADFDGGGIPSDGGWSVHLWENPVFDSVDIQKEGVILPDESTVDEEALSWTYPHIRAVLTPSKVTATQLKGREVDEEIRDGIELRHRSAAFSQPKFIQGVTGLNSAEKGTAVHLVMQYLALDTFPDDRAVRDVVQSLTSRHLLTPEQAEAVDVPLIVDFLKSPLCARIRGSGKVYREYRFNLLVDAGIYDGAVTGEEMMLQGVVDCAFEENGELIIVDFKTDRVSHTEVAARAESYRPQLEAYAMALGRVLDRPIREKILYFFNSRTTINL